MLSAIFPLAPLPVPGPDENADKVAKNESVVLFTNRAKDANPNFEITDETARTVAELCDRLQGIPLAIELAALHSRTMTPSEMLTKIDAGDGFDLLATRLGSINSRHRTYWAAIDWSYRLLARDDQALLAKLSVFRGGWTADAMEAVCETGSVGLEQASRFRRDSLITSEGAGLDEDPYKRFQILEALRQFAESHLEVDELSVLRQRHLEYFVVLAGKAKGVRGPEQNFWLDRFEADYGNLQACLQWARMHDPERGLELAASLARFWDVRGHWTSGRTWLTELLKHAKSADAALRIRALVAIGNYSRFQGDYLSAEGAFGESLKLLSDSHDAAIRSAVLAGLAVLAQDLGDFREARRRFKERAALTDQLGDRKAEGTLYANLAFCAYLENYLLTARKNAEAAVAILEEVERGGQAHANALNNLGAVMRAQGDLKLAFPLLEVSLNLRLASKDRRNLSYSFDEFARLAKELGDDAKATQLLAAAEDLRLKLAFRLPPSEQRRRDDFTDGLRTDLGKDKFESFRTRGLLLRQDEAVKLALSATTS